MRLHHPPQRHHQPVNLFLCVRRKNGDAQRPAVRHAGVMGGMGHQNIVGEQVGLNAGQVQPIALRQANYRRWRIWQRPTQRARPGARLGDIGPQLAAQRIIVAQQGDGRAK